MKGTSIWGLLWLIIVVVTTLMVIVLFSPLIGRVLESAIAENDKFQAMELASAVALTQAAPDGFWYTYDGLPQRDKPGCAKLYKTYVQVETQKMDVPQPETYKSALNITSLGADAEPKGAVLRDHQPIVVDCRVGRKLIFRKAAGKVTVEATS